MWFNMFVFIIDYVNIVWILATTGHILQTYKHFSLFSINLLSIFSVYERPYMILLYMIDSIWLHHMITIYEQTYMILPYMINGIW